MDARPAASKSLDVDFLSGYFTVHERVERPREAGVEFDTDILKLVGVPVSPAGKGFREYAFHFYVKQRKPTTVRIYDFQRHDIARPDQRAQVHEDHRVLAEYAVNIK